jgi:hypothetical protein
MLVVILFPYIIVKVISINEYDVPDTSDIEFNVTTGDEPESPIESPIITPAVEVLPLTKKNQFGTPVATAAVDAGVTVSLN